MAKKKLKFEESLLRLQEILSYIQDPTTSIEECLSLYKEGVDISLHCSKLLSNIEDEVYVLSQSVNESFQLSKLSDNFKSTLKN